MKLVIDISESYYEECKRQAKNHIGTCSTIAKGTPLPKCKDCKYFEYDSLAMVTGIPLIVAHEICEKWGDGCKTSEDGYCFMFEGKE